MIAPARRSMAGGAKKRPTRYAARSTAGDPAALTLALRAHRKGEFDLAVRSYREALARDPGLLDAWMNLGALCALAGRAGEARRAFARARELVPGDGRVHRDAGIGLAAVGDLAAARVALERALDLDPGLLGARLGASRVCAQLGTREAAVAHARRAVADAPGDASAHLELYRACFDDRDLGESLAAAARAVALDPGYALARYFLAGALAFGGRAREAESALGDDGVVAPGLRDAVGYVAEVASRAPGLRAFATAREGLHFALERAPAEGLVFEFGVRHGVSTRALSERAGGATVHGFDSFAGLPAAWQGRGAGAFSTAGELPEVPGSVRLHVGLFADTLGGFLAENSGPVRVAHVDSDLYESARTVLRALAPRVRAGSVLVFDEYVGNARWREDEFRALAEARAEFGWGCEYLALSWITSQAVVRVTSSTPRSPTSSPTSSSS